MRASDVAVGIGDVAADSAAVAPDVAADLARGSPSDAGAVLYEWPTFASTAGLIVNGDTTVVGGRLQITPDSPLQAGSAFLATPIAIGPTTRLEIAFDFQATNSAGANYVADGLALVFHADARGPTALGSWGESLAYGGINPSVVVEVDHWGNGWDPPGGHVAVVRDGAYKTHQAVTTDLGLDLYARQVVHAWVRYDGASRTLDVFMSLGARPATPILTHTVDVAAVVGGSAYLGFTASTGANSAAFSLLSLAVSVTP